MPFIIFTCSYICPKYCQETKRLTNIIIFYLYLIIYLPTNFTIYTFIFKGFFKISFNIPIRFILTIKQVTILRDKARKCNLCCILHKADQASFCVCRLLKESRVKALLCLLLGLSSSTLRQAFVLLPIERRNLKYFSLPQKSNLETVVHILIASTCKCTVPLRHDGSLYHFSLYFNINKLH